MHAHEVLIVNFNYIKFDCLDQSMIYLKYGWMEREKTQLYIPSNSTMRCLNEKATDRNMQMAWNMSHFDIIHWIKIFGRRLCIQYLEIQIVIGSPSDFNGRGQFMHRLPAFYWAQLIRTRGIQVTHFWGHFGLTVHVNILTIEFCWLVSVLFCAWAFEFATFSTQLIPIFEHKGFNVL